LIGLHKLLTGDHSELFGDCSYIVGNLDECEISDEDRKNGVDIRTLIDENKC